MELLGSLQDAPCVDTTQGSGGCILTSTILRLIRDPGITVTDSLVIARGCFQEVYCDDTSLTTWLVTLLIRGFHGISCDGTVQCSALSRGCCKSPRIIWDPGIIPGFSWFSWLIVDLRWHCLRTSNLMRGRTVMFPKVTCMQTLKMTCMQTLKVTCMQTLKVRCMQTLKNDMQILNMTCMTSKHYLMMHAPN